ncbi:MAG: COG1361 S-layer family protein, partial [Peptostreptococcaceae bacterium]
AGLQFVGGSTTVGGAPSGDSPLTGINIASIAAGGSVVVTFDVLVTGIPTPNPYTNTADMTFDDGTGNRPTTPVTGGAIDAQPAGGANLGTSTKSVSNPTPQVGNTITYTITVNNTGLLPATSVVITDVLPAGLQFVGGSTTVGGAPSGDSPLTGINIASIAAGGSVVVTFDVLVSGIPTPNPYTNTADMTFDDGTGNRLTTPVTGGTIDVTAPATGSNLGNTSKFVNKGTPTVGEVVTYTIEIPNTGGEVATQVTVLDLLPVGLMLLGAPTVTGSSGPVTGGLTIPPGLNIGSIAPGSTAYVTFQVLITSLPSPNPYENRATIIHTDSDGTHAFSAVGGLLRVGQPNGADTGGTKKKASNNAPQVGEGVQYTITIPNRGPASAQNVHVYDPMSGVIQFVEIVSVTGSTGPITGNMTQASGLGIGAILPGMTATIIFNVSIEGIPVPNPYENTVTISYSDPTGLVNSRVSGGNLDVTDSEGSNLSDAIKETSQTAVKVGDVINYLATIPNTGTLIAEDVTLLELLP